MIWSDALLNIGWAIVLSAIGSLCGVSLVIVAVSFLPRLIDKLTPDIDEEAEILRGNSAVAEYHGRVSAAAIIGVSIVIAAAVLGGMYAALNG
jgi:drug/metabolite transporter (DMT)-like permease